MIAVRPTDHPYAEVRATIGDYDAVKLGGAASDEIAPGLDARGRRLELPGPGIPERTSRPAVRPSSARSTSGTPKARSCGSPVPPSDVYARGYVSGWETDEGDAGTRYGPAFGSYDEVNLTDTDIGTSVLGVNPNFGYAEAGAARLGAEAAGGPTDVELPIPG